MIVRAATERPMEPSILFSDRQVVDAGDTPSHQAVDVELPVLITTTVIMALIGKAHCDADSGTMFAAERLSMGLDVLYRRPFR